MIYSIQNTYRGVHALIYNYTIILRYVSINIVVYIVHCIVLYVVQTHVQVHVLHILTLGYVSIHILE